MNGCNYRLLKMNLSLAPPLSLSLCSFFLSLFSLFLSIFMYRHTCIAIDKSVAARNVLVFN